MLVRDTGRDREVIPVTVYVAQGQLEANVVKSKLESEGIPAILQYDSATIVYGMTIDGLGEVRVQVPEPLAEAARAILSQTAEAPTSADEGDLATDEDE